MLYNTRSSKKMAISEEIKAYFKNLIEPLPTSDSIKIMFEKFQKDITDKFEQTINEQNEKIKVLEGLIKVKDATITNIAIKCDDLESYSRRSCLRIHGVPLIDDMEIKEDVMTTIEDCYKNTNVVFKSEEFDRAHRIGPVYNDKKSGKNICWAFLDP